MYKNILTVVNQQTFSEAASNYAVHLSKFYNTKLLIFSCLSSKVNAETLKRTEEHINRVFLQAVKLGVNVESVMEKGLFFERLAEKVKEEHIELVFAPITAGNYKEVLDFDKHIPVSLALVRVVSMAKPHPSNILLPLRGRIKNLGEWEEFVSAICHAFHSKATIFYIEKIKKSLSGSELRLKLVDLHENLPDNILRILNYLEGQNIITKKRYGQGKIGRGITIEAASKKNDLIIMGMSERSILKKLLSEDPTAVVIKETPCNLIIFKPKKVI
jgi:nucleotide-binding universal stress UspA family protein